ncbi:MAG TPA: hypothetical protein VEV45_09010 [Streptosporangiaceae bacterium]|nr:hypothetical protein [Streptosporangiaceae bacterium]
MNDAEHTQVATGLGIEPAGAIADMIHLMNRLGVPTTNSYQDDWGDVPRRAGAARRVWICTWTWALPNLMALIDEPAELDDLDSLSNRIAPERVPFKDFFDDDFDLNRRWHYTIRVHRTDGKAVPDRLDIRMPATDVDEVVRRLRMAAEGKTAA